MKRLYFLVITILFSTSAFADNASIKKANSQIGIQFISTDVDYKEFGGQLGAPAGLLDTEKASINGFGINLSVMKDFILGNDYFKFDFTHNKGRTNYVGSYIGSNAGYGSVKSTSGASLIDFDFRFGKGYEISNNIMLTPYLEIGRHEWDRGVNAGENYKNEYLGIGVMPQYSPFDKLVLSASALVGRTFSSNIDVKADASNLLFNASLGTSTIYKVGASIDYAFSESIHGSIGADFTNFKYGISDPVPLDNNFYYAFEPGSKTKYSTLRVGIGYSF